MVTVGELLQDGASVLNKEDAAALLCFLLKTDRAGLCLKRLDAVSKEVQSEYKKYVYMAQKNMPIAYITGEKEFYSLLFEVNESVLIPRPDTEILTEFAVKHADGKKVLDLCCGSGCIGISIAKNSKCEITLADISEDALKIAERNARRHDVRAKFLHLDILNDEINEKFDMILSNPPYIETFEIEKLDDSVRLFEPHLALDGGEDGLKFYRIISSKAYTSLEKGGILAFECGHAQADKICKILSENYKNIQILCDYSNIRRVVTAFK